MTEPAKKKPRLEGVFRLSSKKRKSIELTPDDEFLLLLAKTKVDDIHPRRDIVTVDTSESLADAFTRMNSNSLQSLPVLINGTKWHGYIDILDIVTWMIDKLGENYIVTREDERKIIAEFRSTRVDTVMLSPYGKRNPFHPIDSGSSLLTAVEVLAKGVHRVPIIEGEKLVNIVTQSSVINWIKQNEEKFSKKDLLVAEMDNAFKYVMSVFDIERAIDAFRLMRLARTPGLAIVNENEEIVGNISARDLKKISGDAKFFHRIFSNVLVFEDRRRLPIITVKVENTLMDVINLLEKHHIHRVYIVDDINRPIGVISLTDILAAILPEQT